MKNLKNQNILKSLFVALVSLVILMPFQNCGDSTSNKAIINSNDLSNGLDTGVVNYSPKVDCLLSSSTNSSIFHNVSTISGDNTFSTSLFNDATSIYVDCGETSDESEVGALTFEIDSNYDANNPQFITQSAASFSLSSESLQAGFRPMAIRITDPEGETTIKDFTLAIECHETVNPPSIGDGSQAAIDAAIEVVEGSAVGLFNFTALTDQIDNGGSTNGPELYFAWDFNGDDTFDPFYSGRRGLGSKNIWTPDATLNDIYVNMSTRNMNISESDSSRDRTFKLRVRNSCLQQAQFSVTRALPTSHTLEGDDLAQMLDYHYLQGDVTPTGFDNSDSENVRALNIKRRTGDYLATDQLDADYPTVHRCQLRRNGTRSNLQISTSKRYRDSSSASGGMSLHIVDIADVDPVYGSTVTFPANTTLLPTQREDAISSWVTDNGGGPNGITQYFTHGENNEPDIDQARFTIAGESDGLSQEVFSVSGSSAIANCAISMTMIRAFGQEPCATGPGQLSQTIHYYGEWSCPELSLDGNNSETIEIQNGKFYCEEAIGRRCAGGGGGGGGVTPPAG
ncbi:MAG: hypothetical protein HOO06_05395 [Bdellovibrionaceae bacterium]|jgi:hypothetical protein|nr:hypothetical protein [Pseudobdellovibrionaceae bacterium]